MQISTATTPEIRWGRVSLEIKKKSKFNSGRKEERWTRQRNHARDKYGARWQAQTSSIIGKKKEFTLNTKDEKCGKVFLYLEKSDA